MTINDTLKAKIDELDLDRRLEELTVVTQKAFEEAKGQLGSLAYDNRLKVDEWLHKATDAFDAKTEGKYSDKVAKFSASIEDLVDKVAEKRTAAGAGSTDSGAPQDATSAFPSQTPTDSDATPTDSDATPTDSDATPTDSDGTPTDSDAPKPN